MFKLSFRGEPDKIWKFEKSDDFTVEVYSLAIVLQHDGSFHDVFFDDRTDTNSGVLRTKTKISLAKERLLKRKKDTERHRERSECGLSLRKSLRFRSTACNDCLSHLGNIIT